MTLIVSPARVTLCLSAVVGLLVAASLGAQFSRRVLDHDRLLGLVPLFDLDREGNAPAWFSSMILLVAAGLLAVIARAKWQGPSRDAVHWSGLAVIFVALSLDEAASIHELAVAPIRGVLALGGVLRFAWVIPGALFVAVVGFAYLRFVGRLPAATRWLFGIAGGLYVGGALALELVGGWIHDRWGGEALAYLAEVTLEETAEMAGIVVFIHALLTYIAREVGPVEWRVEAGRRPGGGAGPGPW